MGVRQVSLKHIEAAILKAISDESTSWYEPYTRVALRSTVGVRQQPDCMASWTPVSRTLCSLACWPGSPLWTSGDTRLRLVPRCRLFGNGLQDRSLYVLQGGLPGANPVLLERIMAVEVVTPEDYLGDVIGDLASRRGHVEGMDQRANNQVVRAEVPLAEMFGYATDVRSRTQGRATYTMQFRSYQEVPEQVAKEIVARVRGD